MCASQGGIMVSNHAADQLLLQLMLQPLLLHSQPSQHQRRTKSTVGGASLTWQCSHLS